MGSCLSQSRRRNELVRTYPELISLFNFNGIVTDAKALSCYDGDTIHFAIVHDRLGIIRLKCRLCRIDCPEIKSNDPVAFQARNRVIQLMTNSSHLYFDDIDCILSKDDVSRIFNLNDKIVQVHLKNFDKYGRTLAEVYYMCPKTHKLLNLTDTLLSENLGVHFM